MANLNEYAENHGTRNIIIYVWIDLRRRIKEDTDFVVKTKKTGIDCTPETKPFQS